MGLSSSRFNLSLKDENFIPFEIPDDVLIDVLSFVPADDLIKNCRLVCKLWKEIVDGHGVWKIKCQREKKYFPSIIFEKIPDNYYRLIYLYNPYGINLLRNPCGENSLNGWIIGTTNNVGGLGSFENGFIIEDPPNGAEPVPAEVGSTKCFATTYFPCEKYQAVDLVARGIHAEVIDSPQTKIEVGEWHASRFDCASYYKLEVYLLNQRFTGCDDDNWDDCIVDHFKFEFREEQWIGREWHKVYHVFENVSKTRYIYFNHFGKDGQFWAGHYGSKFTGGYIKFIV